MSLIKCTECKKKVSTKAESCPNCGAPVELPEEPETSALTKFFAWIFVGFFLLVWYAATTQDSSNAGSQSNVISTDGLTVSQTLEKNRRERIENFNSNKLPVITSIKDLINEGDWNLALRRAKLYESTNDEDIKGLIAQILSSDGYKESKLYDEVLKVPASNFQKNRDIYKQLMELNPNKALYREKYEFYQEKHATERERLAAEEAKKKTEDAERNRRLAKFGNPPDASPWDGTYFVVENYLKRIANNPDSIELRSCTDVYYSEDGWLVGCDYTGANAFGGIIRKSNWFIVVHGDVVSMVDISNYSINN